MSCLCACYLLLLDVVDVVVVDENITATHKNDMANITQSIVEYDAGMKAPVVVVVAPEGRAPSNTAKQAAAAPPHGEVTTARGGGFETTVLG